MSLPKVLKTFNDNASSDTFSRLNNPVTVSPGGGVLSVSGIMNVHDRSILTFKAPCGCLDAKSLLIVNPEGVTESYELLDTNGSILKGTDAFVKDSIVSVLIDKVGYKAYVINTTTLIGIATDFEQINVDTIPKQGTVYLGNAAKSYVASGVIPYNGGLVTAGAVFEHTSVAYEDVDVTIPPTLHRGSTIIDKINDDILFAEVFSDDGDFITSFGYIDPKSSKLIVSRISGTATSDTNKTVRVRVYHLFSKINKPIFVNPLNT